MARKTSDHHPPFATVHIPVLEGKAEAIYVARRSGHEWFVGGPGFTEDDDSRFQRVDLLALQDLVDPEAHALDLEVGDHVFQHGDRQPWHRSRIPVGRTFLVTYEVRPTGPTVGPPGVGGACANCWVVCRTLSAARRIAARRLERNGWAIVDVIGGAEKTADDLAEGTEMFFRQAQIDGFVCVMHTFPADDPDVD